MGKLKFVVIAVAVLLVLNVSKNLIVQTVIAGGISSAAKLPVKIASTNASFMASKIDLKGLRVSNPKGFPGEPLFVDAPRILIDFEPRSLFKGTAHFQEVRLDLKEVVVVKNKEGKLNVDAVKPTQEEKDKARAEAEDHKKPGGKKPNLQIDQLYLSIGKVTFKDYSGGGEPRVQVFDIHIQDRKYENIQNPSAIVSVIMFETLTRTTLSRLAGLDVTLFKDGALGALSGGLGVVGDGAQAFEDTAKGVLKFFN